MADFDTDPTDPNRPARCPRTLLPDDPKNLKGARCRALVLVRDADEHERWHDELDALFGSVFAFMDNVDAAGGVAAAEWPAREPQLLEQTAQGQGYVGGAITEPESHL